MKTGIIGEFLQQDGWHIHGAFQSITEARDWANRVDESEGNHHARRWRRVERSSQAWDCATERSDRTLFA